MKDFMLNKEGDLVIEGGKIQLVSDKESLVQKVRQILLTNLSEWEYDLKEGIDRQLFFGKGITEDLLEDNIKSGLIQADETFRITYFSCEEQERVLIVRFAAVNDSGEEIELEL